jgi:hypothetical protein
MGLANSDTENVRAQVVSGSLSLVVSEMQAELRDLFTRDKELRRRIQNVSRVLRRLRADGTQDVANSTTVPHAPGVGRTRDERPRSRPRLNKTTARLQRACRIALLEAGTAISVEEMQSRIERRGSFSFATHKKKTRSLLRVLRLMTRGGEVRCVTSGQCWRWERSSNSHEPLQTPALHPFPGDSHECNIEATPDSPLTLTGTNR